MASARSSSQLRDDLCCWAEQTKQRNSFLRGKDQRKGHSQTFRCSRPLGGSPTPAATPFPGPASLKFSSSLCLRGQPWAPLPQSSLFKGSYPFLQSRLWFSEHTGTGSPLGRAPQEGLLRPSLGKQRPLFPWCNLPKTCSKQNRQPSPLVHIISINNADTT